MRDVQLLIKRGVDINYIDEEGDIFNIKKGSMPYPKGVMTPLLKAIVKKNEAAFDELLRAGVDINKENAKGWTPLEFAISEQQTGMLQKLMKAGCFFSPEHIKYAKEIDNICGRTQNQVAPLLEAHPFQPGKSLLINELDNGIKDHSYPATLLHLIASYDKRCNQNYFFRPKGSYMLTNETQAEIKEIIDRLATLKEKFYLEFMPNNARGIVPPYISEDILKHYSELLVPKGASFQGHRSLRRNKIISLVLHAPRKALLSVAPTVVVF